MHWYAVVGIALGAMAALVGLTATAYRCYNRRIGGGRTLDDEESGETRRLSSAIKKGMGLRKSPSGNTEKTRASFEGGTFSQPGNDSGGGSLERRLSKSPSGHSSGSAGQLDSPGADYCDDGENKGLVSPTEKDENVREKAVDELKIEKLGSLSFSVDYDRQKTALLVTIIRGTDLPAKDPNVGSSDPYVKLQLLPEKRHKVKTRVLRKTLQPVYDEIFTFYGIHANQLAGITLHFVVLSFDRFSRDDVIGEVVYPLTELHLEEKEVTICKEIQPRTIKVRLVFCDYWKCVHVD